MFWYTRWYIIPHWSHFVWLSVLSIEAGAVRGLDFFYIPSRKTDLRVFDLLIIIIKI